MSLSNASDEFERADTKKDQKDLQEPKPENAEEPGQPEAGKAAEQEEATAVVPVEDAPAEEKKGD